MRCWQGGEIADADQALAIELVSGEADRARHIIDLVAKVPVMIWGRDELRAGEMWNSNSVISHLLSRSGVPLGSIHPPAGGRAPGWEAGIVSAGRLVRLSSRTSETWTSFPEPPLAACDGDPLEDETADLPKSSSVEGK
jgi:hypothetical protein